MTYQQCLDYLYQQLPMFSKQGAKAIKPGLANITLLCHALGNPQHHFKTIHVAGTNGKGSTSHLLASMLQQAGYKVGLYTSPHIKHFEERIKLNGQNANKTFVTEFVNTHYQLMQRIQPSFFETTVAMAFAYFAQHKVDYAIVEVGLGGKLDSTNIINPILSVITNIGYDHQDVLGYTLPEIAYEKAGIIKNKIPVVIGESTSTIFPVFNYVAHKNEAQIYLASNYITISNLTHGALLEADVTVCGKSIDSIATPLNGIYQEKNIATALTAWHVLTQTNKNLTWLHATLGINNVIKNTNLSGRWQTIKTSPKTIVDVAHNEDGIKQVLLQLQYESYDKLHIVIGMVKDKDVNAVLRHLPTSATYYFTNAQIPRALPALELIEKAALNNLRGQMFSTVPQAVVTAQQQAAPKDLVLVMGSFFVVAEVDW
jgi:dihydrofolate synthase / folylpolyglutamate synthase